MTPGKILPSVATISLMPSQCNRRTILITISSNGNGKIDDKIVIGTKNIITTGEYGEIKF